MLRAAPCDLPATSIPKQLKQTSSRRNPGPRTNHWEIGCKSNLGARLVNGGDFLTRARTHSGHLLGSQFTSTGIFPNMLPRIPSSSPRPTSQLLMNPDSIDFNKQSPFDVIRLPDQITLYIFRAKTDRLVNLARRATGYGSRRGHYRARTMMR